MEIAISALGLALVLVTLIAFKYKQHLEGQIDEYREANDDLYDVHEKDKKYIKALETRVVERLGPAELAVVLNRVFREGDEDDDPLSDESSAEEAGN